MVVNLSFGNTDSESVSNKQVKTMNDSPTLKLKMFGGPCSGEIQYLYFLILILSTKTKEGRKITNNFSILIKCQYFQFLK